MNDIKFVKGSMEKTKRKLILHQSSDEKLKKLRSQSMNCIEIWSNEIFYEIFDYLDGIDIYRAFLNLNNRFNQLLNCSSHLFKIKIYDSSSDKSCIDIYDQIMCFNHHQIFSIKFFTLTKTNRLNSMFPIDFSFNRLESLDIDSTKPKIIYSLLSKLIHLPNLLSLTIGTYNKIKDLNKIYQLIFHLPKLRFVEVSANEYKATTINVSLPMATANQISSIEYLVIDHPFTFTDLSSIISYTPQLRRLNLTNESKIKSNSKIISPIKLSNLTHISLFMFDIKFDKFEKLISQISSKLKFLSINCLSNDKTYLNAKRLEQFILEYLPQLEKFYLKYDIRFVNDFTSEIYIDKLNDFFSSFWIERKWMLNAELESSSITYSISPYKKKWYEKYSHSEIIISPEQLSKSMELVLTYDSSYHYEEEEEEDIDLCRNLDQILDVTQIYHFSNNGQIFAGTLAQILSHFNKLDSLEITSLLLFQPINLSNYERKLIYQISLTNQIKKVILESLNNIEEVYFLIELCPHIIYLLVYDIRHMDMELFVRLILKKLMIKDSHQLRLLGFGHPTVDDQIMSRLEKMINNEKLLLEYNIKRVFYLIYLQWK